MTELLQYNVSTETLKKTSISKQEIRYYEIKNAYHKYNKPEGLAIHEDAVLFEIVRINKDFYSTKINIRDCNLVILDE